VFEISRQVAAVFEDEARQRFVDRAISHATAFDPAGFGLLPVSARRDLVIRVVQVAEHYAITDQAATILLLEATCMAGPGFPDRDEDEWARGLLETETVDEERTLTYVRDCAIEKRGFAIG
jgi:hypothetical protein